MSPAELRRVLSNRGFYNIQYTDRTLPIYVLQACNKNDRLKLRVNRFGNVLRRNRIGTCARPRQGQRAGRRGMSPAELREVLGSRGFYNIQYTDRRLPVYVLQACHKRDRLKMRFNRFGEVLRRNRIGTCVRPGNRNNPGRFVRNNGKSFPQIRGILRNSGFYNIQFTDRQLPGYGAKACRSNRRLALRLNRFGQVLRRTRIGSCGQVQNDDGYQPIRGRTLPEIRQVLRNNRYYDIQFTDRQLPGYTARACRNIRRFELRINRFGEIRRRKAVGWCKRALFRKAFKITVPHRRISREQMESTVRLPNYDCQDYLENLLESDTILFDVGSDEIGRESFRLLHRLARTINRCPDARVEIAGHTDWDGSHYDNQDLSERRAASVVDFLTDRGVSQRRLRAIGYGESRPIATNETRRGKARNRRIEFVIDWDDE